MLNIIKDTYSYQYRDMYNGTQQRKINVLNNTINSKTGSYGSNSLCQLVMELRASKEVKVIAIEVNVCLQKEKQTFYASHVSIIM